MDKSMRILIVEDQPYDVELAVREIKKIIKLFEFQSVDNPDDFLKAIPHFQPDLIISDYLMPLFTGLDVIRLTKEHAPLVPVIIFTGSINEETAAEAVKSGAVDYVLKDNYKRLQQAILYAIEIKKMWQERVLSEEKLRISEERYRLISSITTDYMFTAEIKKDGSHEMEWIGGAFEKMTGYTIEECKAIGGFNALVHPDDLNRSERNIKNISESNTPNIDEFRFIKKNGEIRWVRAYAHPVWDKKEKRVVRMYGAVQDINDRKVAEEELVKLNADLENIVKERTIELERTNTNLLVEIEERTKAEELINQQLMEKEILLKEVHHRVKNNMQVIISMLNLQSSFVKNKKIVSILHDSQSRIKTMALIHEKLYQTKDFSNIDFSEYVYNLFEYLYSSFRSSNQEIEYNINIKKYQINIDTIISLGLIINELTSNSFKYAFEGMSKGKINILLDKKDDKTLVLSLDDNGKGLPANFDYKNTDSLGLQLVCLLTEQIQGKLEVKNLNKGTKFLVFFPLNN